MADGRIGDFIPHRTLIFSQVVLSGKQNEILSSFKYKDWEQLSFKWIPPFLACIFFYFWGWIFPSVPWYGVSFWRIPLPLYFLSASFLFPSYPLLFSGIEALSVHPHSSRLCSGLPLLQFTRSWSHYLMLSISHTGFWTLFLASLYLSSLFFYLQDQIEMPVGVTTEWRLGFSTPAYTPPHNLPP